MRRSFLSLEKVITIFLNNGEIKVGLYNNALVDWLCVAMGNCFRNDKQALTNKNVIVKRIKKAAELLKKLRDEYRGEGMM